MIMLLSLVTGGFLHLLSLLLGAALTVSTCSDGIGGGGGRKLLVGGEFAPQKKHQGCCTAMESLLNTCQLTPGAFFLSPLSSPLSVPILLVWSLEPSLETWGLEA